MCCGRLGGQTPSHRFHRCRGWRSVPGFVNTNSLAALVSPLPAGLIYKEPCCRLSRLKYPGNTSF